MTDLGFKSIICLNNSDLDKAVLLNKSGSLSCGKIYNSLPSLEANPWPAKNIINSVSPGWTFEGSHLLNVERDFTRFASSSTKSLMFDFGIPNPFRLYS